MKIVLSFILCVCSQIHPKSKVNTYYYIIKNNNCCFDCFNDVKYSLSQQGLKDYSILILYSTNIISNIENKEKLSTIFDKHLIDFTKDEKFKTIKTPAILVVRHINGKHDSTLLTYEVLFKNKKISQQQLKLNCK